LEENILQQSKNPNKTHSNLVVYNLIGKLVEFFFTLLFFYYSRLWFPVDIIGELGAIISLSLIYSFIADLGFSIAHMRIYNDYEDLDSKYRCNGALLVIKLIQISLYIIISIVVFYLSDKMRLYPEESMIIILSNILMLISGVFFTPIFLSQQKIIKNIFTLVISVIVKFLWIIYVRTLNIQNIINLSLSYLVGSIALFTLSFFLNRSIKILKPDYELLKKYLLFSLPFFFSSLAWMISQYLPTLVVDTWYNSKEVAVFITAQQLFLFFSNIPNMISDVLLPALSKERNLDNSTSASRIIYVNQKYFLIIYILIVILSSNFAENIILEILGESYAGVGNILSILLLSNVLGMNLFAIRSDLQVKNHVYFTESLSIIYLIWLIFWLYLFTSPDVLGLGAMGAGISITISQFIYWGIFAFFAVRKYRYHFYWGIVTIGIIAIPLAFVGRYFSNIIGWNIFMAVLISCLLIAIYIGALLLIKVIKMEDLRFWLDLLKPKSIYMDLKTQAKK